MRSFITNFIQGRYGTVKKCTRKSDKQDFAVKEVRSMIEDDYHRSILEADILKRLNQQGNSNIVKQVDFYVNKS